ncbi:DUF5060 domain-containing protein [Lacipirellula parvula]|uniref:DUF5060 domain-containing protein n=1 Tax=Lacipirellula parvula TaxID=2650471 RepID=A0A5K7XEE2_9BACT|nr:DUF5060 domain-containing protein [Lacipirellula parvula]BBO34858.1 hypothetical protein PLANPX_4470 [Lacipirellula parvula]
MPRFLLTIALLLIAPLAGGAPPEFVAVEPTVYRDAWYARQQSPGRDVRPRGIAKNEKFELEIDLKATFENPFDPEQVDLWAEFTAPSGRVWKIWGFYNPSDWDSEWMVRFTPTESGNWSYVVKVRDREGTAETDAAEFRVEPSRRRGFVRIAENRRYLQYADGSSFYGVGLWYNDDYHRRGHGQITETALDELRTLGVNFICFYPTPLETHGSGVGRYDQDRAGRLDEIFAMCEARDIHIAWNLVFHSYISEAMWGGGNDRFRSNPARNVVEAKDWFASDASWKQQQNLYRYIIARWGYSPSLYMWFVVDEINGTEGFQADEAAALAWCRKINDYFHANDPYGRATTGTQSGHVVHFWKEGYEIFDIAAREIYEAQEFPMPAGGKPDLVNDHPLRASYRNYAEQTAKLWSEFRKPAIIGECGFDHTYYEPGMPGYLATYHNALWSALANGSCATPFWWNHSPYLNDGVVTGQIRSFARFVQEINFAGSEWEPASVTASSGDAWAMRSSKLIYGWFANPKNGVAKETFTIAGVEPGEYEVRLYRTWRGFFMDPVTVAAVDGKLTVTVPELVHENGRAQHMGDDVAFKIKRADGQ